MADYPQVFQSTPEARLFTLLPPAHPQSLPPPSTPASWMRPFNIPATLFQAALDPITPATIAILYAVSVKLLNKYNQSRNKKPWAISQTRGFFVFVVLHNVFLAVYSAWTFWGMLGAMRRSIYNPFGPGGLAATADSFCYLQGKPGLGNGLMYNEESKIWEGFSHDGDLEATALDNTQMGRIWNEGLSYYGWIFYMSKFYEVLDTFIILAKGKPSSTLQTYHHTGAMLCMWAGIRYMAAPIWIFVQFNSFIHALMYFYYTLSAFNIRVPMAIKRTLTSMQISQFILGASSAVIHSFITYIIPVTTTTLASQVAHPSPAAAEPTGALDSIKQYVMGGNARHQFNTEAGNQMSTQTHTRYVAQPCITTTGETFAIWVNMVYLAPLTYLFVSFFIASYVKRTNAAQKANNGKARREINVTMAEKAGWDAAKSVEEEMYGGERMVDRNGVVKQSKVSGRVSKKA